MATATSRPAWLLDLQPFRVTPEPAFYGDVKALLGAGAIGGSS